MSRMESPRDKATITVRVDETVKEQYKSEVDSMSDDLRRHIEGVATDDSNGPRPDDDRLAAAYDALREVADPHTNRVDTDLAQSTIAQASQIPGKAVRGRILRPLEREGWITPKWGQIVVHPPSEVDHV